MNKPISKPTFGGGPSRPSAPGSVPSRPTPQGSVPSRPTPQGSVPSRPSPPGSGPSRPSAPGSYPSRPSAPGSRPSASGPSKFRKDSPGAGPRDRKKNENDPFNINEAIRAREVRVIGPDGKMLGVIPTPQAVQMAKDFGLDLIEVAPDAAPPTCKIMDYGKWKYENKKKNQANKKKQVIIVVKEIQIRPRTDEHDLEVKLRHARRFLLDGDKVKINMRFQGREMAYQEQGRSVMAKVVRTLSELAVVESDPKSEGKQLFALLGPDPVKIKEFKQKHPDQKKKVAEKHEELVEEKDEVGDEE